MATPSRAPKGAVAEYRFGPYEADVRNAELRKFGTRVRVERKPWLLLLTLLKADGQLVKRSELERQLWPEGLFVDFEHGLNVAVQKLRQALCDSADQPRYIETVAREGYRFIAPIECVAPPTVDNVDETTPAGSVPVLAPPPLAGQRRGPVPALIAVSLLLIAAMVGLLGWRSTPSVKFAAKNWLLIGDFDNRTGQPVLDGTLEAALERELSNSKFVRIAPRERAEDALRLMRKPPNSRIDRAVGREICLRDGDIHALITGRVEKLGPTYVLAAAIVNPENGVTYSSLEEEVQSETQLASAVRRLSGRVREALGENPQVVQQSLEKLEKVTTPSLRALQLFSQADRMLRAGPNQWPNKSAGTAAQLLEEAVREDPNFASAHLWLYYAYENLRFMKDPALLDKAEMHLKQAFELADTVPEREKLFIQASYFRFLQRPRDAIDALETLVQAYPDHLAGLKNLEQMYSFYSFGQFKNAERAALHLLELRPHDIGSAVQSAAVLTMYLWDDGGGSNDEIQRVGEFNQRIWRRMQSPREDASLSDKARMSLVLAAQHILAGNVSQANDEYGVALRNHRGGDGLEETLIHTAALLGKLHEAQRFAASMSPSVSKSLCEANVAFLLGDFDTVRRLETEISRDPTYVDLDDAVALPIRLEMRQLAEQMHRKVTDFDKKYELKSYLDGKGVARRQEGELAFARGEVAKAIVILDRNDLKEDRHSVGAVLAYETLADAYWRQHRPDDAVRVLQEGANEWGRPVNMAATFRMRLRLKLADLYRELGRIQEAEKIEAQLRKQLTYADADNPMRISLQRRLSTAPRAAYRAQ